MNARMKEVCVFESRSILIRRSPQVARRIRQLAAVLLVAALLAACGSDEGLQEPPSTATATFETIIATFTPVPPDYTPEILLTRAAEQTAWSLTATAEPPTTATPASGNMGGGSQAPEGVLQPPTLIMIATGGQVAGDPGSYVWCEEATNTCADIRARWVDLSGSGISWAKDTPARFSAPASPYALVSADITIYPYDGNIVIPTDGAGNTADHYAFLAQTAPVFQQSLNGPDLLLNANLQPGFHIIEVVVHWQTPQGLPTPLKTQYAFVVEVM
jgi:hypothetical protein